jgi:hypothetical protein
MTTTNPRLRLFGVFGTSLSSPGQQFVVECTTALFHFFDQKLYATLYFTGVLYITGYHDDGSDNSAMCIPNVSMYSPFSCLTSQ